MKKTFQIIIIISLTFILGFVIGFLVNGRLVSNRIDKMRNYYKETGFTREIMHIIKPTPEQEELIIPILKEHAEEVRDAMMELRKEQGEIFQETKEDLEEILTEEQMKRLDNYWSNMRKRIEDNGPGKRKYRGKPHGEKEHRGRR